MARTNLTFSPAVPQIFADVDKDKVFKLGISISDVYQALQSLLGGFYVNQFNRFGRVWKVFVEAEPEYRTQKKDVGQFYVRNQQGRMVPLSTLVRMRRDFGPEYTTRFNEYRGIEIFAVPGPGYSTGDAMKAIDGKDEAKISRLEIQEVGRASVPPGVGAGSEHVDGRTHNVARVSMTGTEARPSVGN